MFVRINSAILARAPVRALLLFAVVGGSLGACVRERTLFEDSGEGGGQAGDRGASGAAGGAGDSSANAGAASAAGMAGVASAGAMPISEAGASGSTLPAWNEKTCVAALSAGKTGDPCVDSFKCTATSNCCQIVGYCQSGALSLQNTCDVCITTCTTDADCGAGRLCDNYECRDCPGDACPENWNTVIRNSCKVCVPPNQCKDKAGADCDAGQICVAGLSCLSGCKDDPACCFGNQCADAVCGPPEGVDCLSVGCAAGSFCKVAGPAVACACNVKIGKWSCATPPVNSCAPH